MALTAIHPGEHLVAELKELGISAANLHANSMFRPIALPRSYMQDAPSRATLLCVWLTFSAPPPNSG